MHFISTSPNLKNGEARGDKIPYIKKFMSH